MGIQYRITTGEIIDLRHYTESQTTSSGGGGAIYNGSGYIRPIYVEHSETPCLEFWVRNLEGIEESFWMRNLKIPLRTGQRISLLVGNSKIIALRNFSSKQWHYITKAEAFVPEPMKLGCGAALLATVAGLFVGMFALGFLESVAKTIHLRSLTELETLVFPAFGLLGLIGMLCASGVAHRRHREKVAALDKEMDKMVEQLLSAKEPGLESGVSC